MHIKQILLNDSYIHIPPGLEKPPVLAKPVFFLCMVLVPKSL